MINFLITIPILGIITAFLGVIIEQILAVLANILWQKELVFNFYNNLAPFLIASALIEENLKYSAIYFIAKGKLALEGWRLSLASLLLGLFWGIAEVFLIVITQPQYMADIFIFKSDIFLSAIFIILLHTLTAFTMGVIISTETFSKYFFSIRVVLLTTFIHLIFNFLIIQQGNFTNILAAIIFGIVFFVDLVILAFNFKFLAR
jgi:hypothetical protein